MTWIPTTLEDRLLARYHEEQPGRLYLEFPVGGTDERHGPRRLDGLLIPGPNSQVLPQGEYTVDAAHEEVRTASVHLLEAKRNLNRNVIGQVIVGRSLLRDQHSPASIEGVAVCSDGNRDLEPVCDELDIRVVIYGGIGRRTPETQDPQGDGGRRDVRRPPDSHRRRTFMSGWSDAVDGLLYETIRSRKTHANMGNLFGWIYGDQTASFREETWERYVASLDLFHDTEDR